MTDKADWLAGLKEGDLVVVESTNPFTEENVLIAIERLTPTQIVMPRGSRYWRKNGRRVGRTGFYTSWIEQPTAAQVRKAGKAKR